MKLILAVGILAQISTAAPAGGIPYSRDAVELLNIVSHCPQEFSEISKRGSAGAAVREGTEVTDTYTIGFSAGGRAPTFARYAVGSLEITRTFQPSTRPNVPDAAGGAYVYTCKVNYVR